MREVIFTLLMSAVYLLFWMFQVDDSITVLANERLKNALNYAAHDACLQINKSQLGRGRVVFDHDAAESVFCSTLSDNLSLNPGLDPKPQTLFKEKITVIYADYIDDNDGVAYPYLYENRTYGIRHLIYGPAVVFAVRAPRPRVFNVNPGYDLVRWAVFEYPVPVKRGNQ